MPPLNITVDIKAAIERMLQLRKILIPAIKAYYVLDDPIMSDKEYDIYYDELDGLEKLTGIILGGSPTQTVQGGILPSLTPVEHKTPMLSADKTKSVEKVITFSKGKILILSWKLDGLTIVIKFHKGKLIQAITRGDKGLIGEDVTEQAKFIQNLPLTIPYDEDLEIRGECVMPWDAYNDFYEAQTEQGITCGHARNVASGAIRQLDTSKIADKGLMFKAFAITQSSESFTYKHECLDFLKSIGFDTVEYVLVQDAEEIKNAVAKTFLPENYAYPVDGLIFEFEDIAYGKSLGATEHHPLSIMALKWEDETHQTKFLGIDLNTTKTGIVSMTAMFETVRIESTNVSRATVPNLDYFHKYKFGLQDFLSIYKANKIIPTIFKNETQSGTYPLPDTCPSCGSKLEIKGQFLYCPNEECSARKVREFTYFASKKCMNIDGLAEKSLSCLLSHGWIHSFHDIYYLSQFKDKIIELDGYGEKSYAKLIDAIEKSRDVTFEHLFAALNIPNCGFSAGKIISKRFQSDVAQFQAAVENGFDFTELPGIGKVMHGNITTWFSVQKNMEEWKNLLNELHVIVPEIPAVPVEIKDNPFKGKSIIATGTLDNFTRESINEKIESLGAKVSSGVTKKTDYVLAGKEPGQKKIIKAQELNVKIISEAEFLAMID